jgi:hypothetical protein
MKFSRGQDTKQNKSVPGHRPRPQNKDDLDSRENLEQDNKGEDVTHNRKEMKSDRKKVKNDNETREL